jgi:hypothetical protein
MKRRADVPADGHDSFSKLVRGHVKVRRSYEIRSAGELLAIEDARSAQEALLLYLRAHGCPEEEFVTLRPDVIAWGGSVFRAVLASSHLHVVDRKSA